MTSSRTNPLVSVVTLESVPAIHRAIITRALGRTTMIAMVTRTGSEHEGIAKEAFVSAAAVTGTAAAMACAEPTETALSLIALRALVEMAGAAAIAKRERGSASAA